MRLVPLLIAIALPVITVAQTDLLAARHARISALYEANDYAGTIREIDLQVKEAPGSAYADSLHRYLYKYGRAHRKLKDAAAGVAAAERIYALVKQRGNAANELEALFDLSWTYYDVGEMKQCARVDSIAVTVADRDATIPLGQRGRARQYLAFDYSVIGDHRKSEKYALEAIAQYQKADSIPAKQWAESYTAAGVANWHLGRIRAAEGYYLKALERLGEGTDAATLERKVSTYGNLGVLWQNAGDFARAKHFYHESLRCSNRVIAGTNDPFQRDEATVNRSRTYVNLATVYQQSGDDGKARELLAIAWRDRSAVLEPDDPQLLSLKERMSDIELGTGNLEKAESLLREYVVSSERKYGPRSEEYIRSSSKLGHIAMRQGFAAKADSLFAVSLAAGTTSADETTDVVRSRTLQHRARLRLEAKRFPEAMADLRVARAIMVRTYDSLHYKVAAADVLLAEAAFAAGDANSARDHAASALRILADRVRALRTSRLPQTFPDPHLLPDALYWKVMAERMPGDTRDRSEWIDDINLAITALARNRTALEDEASKLLLVGAQKRLFDLALDIAYEAYSASGSEKDLERFLVWSEADRSILLKGRLNAFAGLRFSGVPDSIVAKEQELIAALDITKSGTEEATNLDKRELAYDAFLKRLESEYPSYFNLRYGETSITLADLRRRLLTKDRQLLAYAFTDTRLYALLVGQADAQLIRMDASSLERQVRSLNEAIASRSAPEYLAAAHALFGSAIAPLQHSMRASELLIIPDGPLHAVSFESLVDAPSTATDFKQHLLLQRRAIAYLLSATTAVQFAGLARQERSRGALAIAPGFSDELKQDYLSRVKDSSMVDGDFLRYVRQPFAMRTAEGLGNTMQARLLLGGAATERNFRAAANDHGILHLGTHAEMNAANPMYSRLVLSKDGLGVDPDADGYLHAYELYELDLRAQLAVLTACETGTGRQDAGEGVRSLGYSFAYAGCPSLVMSLWSIDEQSSSAIIARFYELLADGLPKHEALRQAKLDHLAAATDELALPYYWAGLVLVGDVSPVDTAQPRLWMWLIGGALLLCAGLLYRRWRRQRSLRLQQP